MDSNNELRVLLVAIYRIQATMAMLRPRCGAKIRAALLREGRSEDDVGLIER